MRNRLNDADEQARRIQADQEELADRIARALPRDGTVEPQPGLHFRRHSRPAGRVYGSYAPAFCVIAQGSKDILLGEDIFRYNPAPSFITTMQLPLLAE